MHIQNKTFRAFRFSIPVLDFLRAAFTYFPVAAGLCLSQNTQARKCLNARSPSAVPHQIKHVQMPSH